MWRRFFIALLALAIGIAVPPTLEPSTGTLVALWVIVALALAGVFVTWEPVAQRLPYRIVRNAEPSALSPETLSADAALAEDCKLLADDIDGWRTQPVIIDLDALAQMPDEWSDLFNGRLFRILEALVVRRYITRDDMRRRSENHHVLNAESTARYLRNWAHRLRRQ
jgi:hypothetical protein